MTEEIIKRNKPKVDNIVLAIDFGEKNIGLAFGRNGLSTPLNIVSGKNLDQAINEISKVVYEYHINKIVVGLPLTAEQKETHQSIKTRRFANVLKARLKKPITFVEEYGTSSQAAKASIEVGQSKKQRKSLDNLSAALILKRYFDQVRNQTSN